MTRTTGQQHKEHVAEFMTLDFDNIVVEFLATPTVDPLNIDDLRIDHLIKLARLIVSAQREIIMLRNPIPPRPE